MLKTSRKYHNLKAVMLRESKDKYLFGSILCDFEALCDCNSTNIPDLTIIVLGRLFVTFRDFPPPVKVG